MRGRNVKYQLKIMAIALGALFFLSFLWVYLETDYNNRAELLVQNWIALQDQALSQIVSDAEGGALETDLPNLLSRLNYSEASYGFLYGNGKVIYECDQALTNAYQGQTIRELYGTYSYAGGEHLLDILEPMERGESGSGYFIKKYSKGKEYVTWRVFQQGGAEYILGIATPETYILGLERFEESRTEIRAFAAIYSFLLILIAGLLIFMVYRHDILRQKHAEILQAKEIKIRSLTSERRDLEEELHSLAIRDMLTGVYNRRFFDAFFPKMDADVFLPTSIAFIDINGLKLINNALGYAQGDAVLVDTVAACRRFCREDDVLVRYGNDEFIMIMINTPLENARLRMEAVCSYINDHNRQDLRYSISYGVATRMDQSQTVQDALDEAENTMNVDKLSSSDSVHSSSLVMLKKILEDKTSETEEHCERIKHWASSLAEEIGLEKKKIEEIGLLAYLHDIGKIAIPDSILEKQASLTEDEMAVVRTHSEKGYNIAMASPDLQAIAKPILQHHERWDGTGYPNGLSGEQIALEARIISIADTFDAITNRRVYKEEQPVEFALSEIERCAGSQFDPALARVFVKMVRRELDTPGKPNEN